MTLKRPNQQFQLYYRNMRVAGKGPLVEKDKLLKWVTWPGSAQRKRAARVGGGSGCRACHRKRGALTSQMQSEALGLRNLETRVKSTASLSSESELTSGVASDSGRGTA